ncbi:hypothetical protein XA68_17184 [Ophiocordyceps unilateralis]|uniref:F-box domain-containing protein n=1 Tax=Ophiocordyceps unilateralis TaxID=268505 RepID=A0A2A9P576_OPHUN|nr:hypothetical protein XA68_17184 [Ophiocordyceps unilateralis]
MTAKRRKQPDGGDDDDDDNDNDQDNDNGHRPPPALRRRAAAPRDIISTLSDELLVRILSYMDERVLLTIAPVSRRLHRIASDGQLWRRHYYLRFILPRAYRIPGFRRPPVPSSRYSDKVSGLVESVDWKKQYRLRHNWARGRCAVDQLLVREAVDDCPLPVLPPPEWQTLVKVVDGLAVTADAQVGLRAWDLRTRKLVAQSDLDPCPSVRPTCLAVDDQWLKTAACLEICAGFHDGTFAVWRLHVRQRKLALLFRQEKGYLGPLVAIAYRHPYVLSAASFGFISLYTFDPDSDDASRDRTAHGYRWPCRSAKRRRRWWPPSRTPSTPSAAGPSRVACTLPTQTRSTEPSPGRRKQQRLPAFGLDDEDEDEDTGPIRLCYSHPYLLATLPDNCMVLHLCTSTATSLTISPGIRLWGHTSGISDAEITPRGKAVSVSTRGDEIRLWELEGRVGGTSVEIRPRAQAGGEHQSEKTPPNDAVDLSDRKNWVGFDDEMVVVLKEARDGEESLMVYDFT